MIDIYFEHAKDLRLSARRTAYWIKNNPDEDHTKQLEIIAHLRKEANKIALMSRRARRANQGIKITGIKLS